MNDLVVLGVFTLAIFVTGFVCGGAATAWQLVERRPRPLRWDEEPCENGPFGAPAREAPLVFPDEPRRPPVELRPLPGRDAVEARHAEIVRVVDARLDAVARETPRAIREAVVRLVGTSGRPRTTRTPASRSRPSMGGLPAAPGTQGDRPC